MFDKTPYIPSFYGEINGHNIYDDVDAEGEYDYSESNYPPPTKFKLIDPRTHWKCADEKVILIKEMTDKHLINSIAFCERHGIYGYVSILSNELERRKNEKEKLKKNHE